MARPLRILHPGTWYPLTARGIERRALFRDDRATGLTIAQLAQAAGVGEPATVSLALRRFRARLQRDPVIHAEAARAATMLLVTLRPQWPPSLPYTSSAGSFFTSPFDPAPVPRYASAMVHTPGFLKLVADARSRVHEITVDQLRERLQTNPRLAFLDVREESEWAAGHAVQARHLGKGILERDLETLFPDPDTEIVMYCGGGFRSALTCDAAQKLGHRNVHSLIGGYTGLLAAGWEMAR